MKKIIITFFIIAVWVISINYFAQCAVYKTLVGKWYFQAQEIKEPNFHGGYYLQINDSLRIVKKKTPTSELMRVQLKVAQNSYVNTAIFDYPDIFNNNKWEILRSLQSQWEDNVKLQNKSFFNSHQ